MSTREKGYQGEEVAERYLRDNGYVILTKNFYSRNGEVDIIAKKGDLLVFVEVKSYEGSYIDPKFKMTKEKIKRIVKTAQYFIHKHKLYSANCQFDFISVKNGAVAEHIENYEIGRRN